MFKQTYILNYKLC